MKTNEIIKELRISKGYKQKEIAELLELPYTTYNNYESGRREIGSFTLMKIAKIFGVTIDSLLDIGQNDIYKINTDIENLPKCEPSGEVFALKVKGRSMEPRIFEGDIAIVKQQKEVQDGDIAVLRLENKNVVVKKVFKQENGLLLTGLNGAVYSPTFLTYDQFEIIGKVIEIRVNIDEWNK